MPGLHLWLFAGSHADLVFMSEMRVPLYRPDLRGNERAYVDQCMATGWISSIGSFIARFETAFASYIGIDHAIGVANGTVALHLVLHCLNIGCGDEVIVPTFTYIAAVNAIAQTGAKPIFVDSRSCDWLIDPDDVKRKITQRTKAIMAVHLYGAICDMPALRKIADENGVALIEDCAEAFGSTLNGRHAGTLGDIGTFSFFGNKTITTGEGGMVVLRDAALAERLRRVKGSKQPTVLRYWQDEIVFNYRMTNICAAIGLAQIERIDAILERKREIADFYRRELRGLDLDLQRPMPGASSSEWLFSMLLPSHASRDRVMADMARAGVDTRPVFFCAHHMPMYRSTDSFHAAENIAARGLSLPSFPSLTEAETAHVAQSLLAALQKSSCAL